MNSKELVRRLEKAGFIDLERKGKTGHRLYRHPERPGVTIIVPMHSGEVSPRVLKSIAKQAQLDI